MIEIFLQGLTTTVYGFKDKEIKEYLGDIDYFLEQHKIENLREAEKRTVVKAQKDTSKKDDYKATKDQEKALKKLNNKLSNIESKISNLEKEIAALDVQLAENYEQTSQKPDFFKNYKLKKATLDTLMEDWEVLEAQISNV
jgi:hypothetical protein